jgi:EpsI family protein
MNSLKGLPVRILMVILLLQAAAYYAVAFRGENIPPVAPLSEFPRNVDRWTMAADYPIEPEVESVLRADDTLNRVYVTPDKTATASLFVAFFRTQRYGQAPHSPKNCLPGAGWMPREDRQIPLQVAGPDTRIVVNQYVITRGDQESLVLYWYQSHNRVIARELTAKFWLVADAIRYHRSDTALVRIIVPVVNNATGIAQKMATDFAQAVYPDLVRQLPH